MSDWDVTSTAPAPQAADPAAPAPQAPPAAAAAAPAVAANADGWGVDSEAPAPGPSQSVSGAVNAAATGFNSGALDVVGMVGDTTRNIKELAKAAVGAPIMAITGKASSVPAWLQPEDPDQYKHDIGSSDWLKQQVRNLGGGNLIDNTEKTKLNQYLNAAGEGAGAALAGGGDSVPAVARSVGTGALGGGVSVQLQDMGASPGVAGAAGLLTAAATHHLTSTAPKPVEAPPEIPKATVDPAERILKTPSLPGPTPSDVEGKGGSSSVEGQGGAGVTVGPKATASLEANAAEVKEATQASDFSQGEGAPSPVDNNGSSPGPAGAASVEAINRAAAEKAAGQDRYVINADGKATPLVGVDAADTVAAPGTIIVQKGVGANPVTVLDRGGLPAEHAQGLLQRAVEQGELTPEGGKGPATEPATGTVKTSQPLPASQPEPYVNPGDTHPMRNGQPYAMISAERSDATPQENARNTQMLGQYLQANGLRSAPVQGSYQGVPEHSYAVQTPSVEAQGYVNKLGQVFKQDSVMHVDANQNATLHYGDGRQEWLGSMKQVPASEAQSLPGWSRDENGNFYTVKPPAATEPGGVRASASQSLFGDPAKTGGNSEVGEPEQARRASTFKRIGLDEVRKSALTGNQKEAATDFQTSKLDHPGGQRMTAVQEAERNALIQHADNMVSESGGSKGLDQMAMQARGRTLAAPVDGYDEHLEKATQRIYDIAKTVAAGKPIQTGGLATFMTKKKSEFLGTVEGKQLLEGVKARMNELGLMGDNDTFHPATIEQAERLRQYIGQQWQPKLTQLIAALKNHLDNDVAASAGKDIFKQAREIRALRAKVLEEPEAVSKLRLPKEANRLGINRNIDLNEIPNYIAELPPDQFGHYIDVLKQAATASPELWSKSLAAIREVRSQYANEVMAAGNKTAGAWNQKAVNQYLKDHELNMRKVFTSEELGKWQDLDNAGRWLHQDKTYPGAEAQKQNFITGKILPAVGHGAELVGATMGHVPGWAFGKAAHAGIDKIASSSLARTVEARIVDLNGKKAPKSEVEEGMQGAGPAEEPLRADSGAFPKQRGGPKAAPKNMLFRHFSNATEPKVTLDPEKYGTGLKGAESKRVAGGAPKSTSLYSIDHPDDQVERELRGKTEYRVSVPTSKLYDLSADPKGVIDKVLKRNDGVYDHTQVEKAVKSAGYVGYHLPQGEGIFQGQARLFKPVPAVRVDQLKPSDVRKPLSLALPKQRGGPAYDPYDSGPVSRTAESAKVRRNNPTYDYSSNPYDTAPQSNDPWAGERVKNERGGPALSSVFSKQRGGPKFEAPSSITKYLTEPEKSQLRTDTAMRMVEAFHDPALEGLDHQLAAAALAGQAKRGWYDQSAKAITNVFGPDAPRFTALLAAMSPQTSVQMNFHNALRTFINWDKAGRPEDPAQIKSIMEQSSLKSPVAKAESKSNVLGAWVPNAVRVLTHPEPENLTLSGPKVDSFMKNLQGHVNAVTLDAWMASFAHIDPNKFAGGINKAGTSPGKSPTYLSYSAQVRKAAELLTKKTGETWTPAEVQETVWSWAKTAYEHADEFGGMATIPELVKNGEITDELIKSTPAFDSLFQEAGHSAALRDSRFSGGLDRLHEGAGSDTGNRSPSEKADAAARSLKTHLYRAAERLEGVRQERAVARGKTTSPLLGDDTEF